MLERLGNVLYWLGSGVGVLCVVLSIIAFNGPKDSGDHVISLVFLAIAVLAWGFGKALRYILSGK